MGIEGKKIKIEEFEVGEGGEEERKMEGVNSEWSQSIQSGLLQATLPGTRR